MQALRRGWAGDLVCRVCTRDLLIPLLLVLLAAFTFFWRLGEGSLYDWDEAIHAQMAQEMIWRHDVLTPHQGGTPHFTKPPLYQWQTLLAYKVFGVNEFAARFWAALSGVGAVVMTCLLGRELFDRPTGLGAALLLLIVSNLPYSHGYNFVSIGRMCMMTAPLTFYALLTLWLAWRGQRDRRYLVLIGLPVGAAVMTKNVAGLAPLGAVLVYWLLTWPLKAWPWRELGLAALVAAAIILPWHASQALMHPHFIRDYLLYNVLQRAASTLDTQYHSQPAWFYLDVIRKGFSHAWVILPAAVAYAIYRIVGRRERAPLLLIIWALIPLTVYSLARTKLAWYILEVYPALALLGAWLLTRLVGRRWSLVAIVVFLAVAGWRPPSPRDGAPDVKRVAPLVSHLAARDDLVLLCMRGDDLAARPASLFYAGRAVEHVTFNGGALARACSKARYLLTDADTWQAAGLAGEVVCRSGTQLLVRFPP